MFSISGEMEITATKGWGVIQQEGELKIYGKSLENIIKFKVLLSREREGESKIYEKSNWFVSRSK